MLYDFEVLGGKTRENITSSYMRMLEWVTVTCMPKFDLGLPLFIHLYVSLTLTQGKDKGWRRNFFNLLPGLLSWQVGKFCLNCISLSPVLSRTQTFDYSVFIFNPSLSNTLFLMTVQTHCFDWITCATNQRCWEGSAASCFFLFFDTAALRKRWTLFRNYKFFPWKSRQDISWNL